MSKTEMLSRRLRELREEAGLSQAQLAEELSVSRGSISYYENGDRTPDVDFLMKTKDYFGVDYEYLLGESAIKNHRDRTSIEAAIEHLPDEKSSSIFYFVRMLIQCAELYGASPDMDVSSYFEKLTADILTYIEAYKNIPYDLTRYDERTAAMRFYDRVMHTNAMDVVYNISRYKLLKEQREGQRETE